MFDTHVTVIGTALNTPEKRITKTDTLVATLRIASHARRFDKETQQWVDGPTFRVRVNCWRRLGEFVLSSIVVGDPIVVYGRIVTREWKTEQGETRLAYEIEADAVGHDLARGRSTFQRWRPEPFGTVVEDADADARINGELADTVEDFEPASIGSAFASGLAAGFAPSEVDDDAMAILRDFDPIEGGDGDGGDDDADSESGGDSGSGSGRGRRRGRATVPA